MSTEINQAYQSLYIHLEKTAYDLADAMAATSEIREFLLQRKNMDFKDWVTKFRHLLSGIDRIIYQQSEQCVFLTGLHSLVEIPPLEEQAGETWDDVPLETRKAATTFGKTFREMLDLIDHGKFDPQLIAGQKTPRFKKKQDLRVFLCKEFTELILNEFGLHSTDIAKLY